MTDTARALNDAMEAAAGGRLPYLDMRVIFDDGRQYVSHADQRDMRRAMVAAGVSDPDLDPIGFSRASAWSYLTRTGAIDGLSWADFDAQVPFVIPSEEATGADPTGTATAD